MDLCKLLCKDELPIMPTLHGDVVAIMLSKQRCKRVPARMEVSIVVEKNFYAPRQLRAVYSQGSCERLTRALMKVN